MSEPISTEAATGFLVSRYGAERVADVAPLGAGDWSRAYSLLLDGREVVARFGNHREDFEADLRAMGFAGPDLPVPRVTEIGDALGGSFAISERHHGEFLERLGVDHLRRTLPALLRLLDALRELPQAERAAGEATWRRWLLGSLEDVPGRRVSGWSATLAAWSDIEEAFVAGAARLRSLAPRVPELAHVIHGDLINRNVLVDVAGAHIEAVFDWGTSKRGDFVYEIAYLGFWSPWYEALAALDIVGASRAHLEEIGIDVPDFDLRVRAYQLQIALEHIAYNAFSGRSYEESLVLAEAVARLA